jgi:hypothetical protein
MAHTFIYNKLFFYTFSLFFLFFIYFLEINTKNRVLGRESNLVKVITPDIQIDLFIEKINGFERTLTLLEKK